MQIVQCSDPKMPLDEAIQAEARKMHQSMETDTPADVLEKPIDEKDLLIKRLNKRITQLEHKLVDLEAEVASTLAKTVPNPMSKTPPEVKSIVTAVVANEEIRRMSSSHVTRDCCPQTPRMLGSAPTSRRKKVTKPRPKIQAK